MTADDDVNATVQLELARGAVEARRVVAREVLLDGTGRSAGALDCGRSLRPATLDQTAPKLSIETVAFSKRSVRTQRC